MNWHNIRSNIAKNEIIQPGGVFSGSGLFIFCSEVKDPHMLDNIKMIVTDFTGKKTFHSISITKKCFTGFDKGFMAINRRFLISSDKTFQWE